MASLLGLMIVLKPRGLPFVSFPVFVFPTGNCLTVKPRKWRMRKSSAYRISTGFSCFFRYAFAAVSSNPCKAMLASKGETTPIGANLSIRSRETPCACVARKRCWTHARNQSRWWTRRRGLGQRKRLKRGKHTCTRAALHCPRTSTRQRLRQQAVTSHMLTGRLSCLLPLQTFFPTVFRFLCLPLLKPRQVGLHQALLPWFCRGHQHAQMCLPFPSCSAQATKAASKIARTAAG